MGQREAEVAGLKAELAAANGGVEAKGEALALAVAELQALKVGALGAWPPLPLPFCPPHTQHAPAGPAELAWGTEEEATEEGEGGACRRAHRTATPS
jgi:hypothetical protein